MGTIATTIKIDADARSAVSGLKPLETSLDNVVTDAQQAESALTDLGKSHKISLNDQAIDTAQQEITRLRAQMREDLSIDVNADVRSAQTRIRQLQSAVRTLDAETVDIKAVVSVDDSDVEGLTDSLAEVQGSPAGGGFLGAAAGAGALRAALTLGTAGTVISGIAGGLGLVGYTAFKASAPLITLADNMENAGIAFSQFLGSDIKADKFLNELQAFGAKTPFEFPELVDASKKLLAFGTEADDVIGIMTTLGDAAALTGADVGDLTTIWGQMQAKGRVSNEELLQLTESGIPAYDALADSMGKTVPEIQKMAEEGKLLSDDVLPKLKKGLDETFGGGMAEQAETLAGKWSTIKDSLGAIGTDLGEALLPFAKAIVDEVQPALDDLAVWVGKNRGQISLAITAGAGHVLDFTAGMIDAFGHIIEAIGGTIEWIGDLVIKVGQAGELMSALPGVPDDLGKGIVDAGEDIKDFGDTAADTGDKFHGVADGMRDAADTMREKGREIAEGFKADELRANISESVAEIERLQDLPRTHKVDIKIDAERGKLAGFRHDLDQLTEEDRKATIDADVDRGERKVRRFKNSLDYLRTLKPTPQVKLDIEEAERKLKRWREKLREAEEKQINFYADADTTPAQRKLLAITQEKRVPLKLGVEAPQADDVDRKVDGIANKKRTATIDTKLKGDDVARTTLDRLAVDRYSTIHVNVVRTSSGGTSGGGAGPTPQLGPQLLGADSATVAGLRATAQAAPTIAAGTPLGPLGGAAYRAPAPQPEVVRLAPRQTPIQVLLDGHEISSHLELRRDLAAVESVKRTA